MNQPYVKEYLKDDEGNFVLDDRGRKIVSNPITDGYFNFYPNKQQRNAILNQKKFNNRKGRHYYQPRMKPVYDPIGGKVIDEATGEREKIILYSVPDGTSIKHHVAKLPRKG